MRWDGTRCPFGDGCAGHAQPPGEFLLGADGFDCEAQAFLFFGACFCHSILLDGLGEKGRRRAFAPGDVTADDYDVTSASAAASRTRSTPTTRTNSTSSRS